MPRPTAADVLNASSTMPGASHVLAALRAAVDANPDDIVCFLPDGTLNVAERYRWELFDLDGEEVCGLYTIPGAD